MSTPEESQESLPSEVLKKMLPRPQPLGQLLHKQLPSAHSWIKPVSRKNSISLSQPYKITTEELKKYENVGSMTFRRILLNNLLDERKPEFEQSDLVEACKSLMDLMDLRKKYLFIDNSHILQHPFLNALDGTSTPGDLTEMTQSVDFRMEGGIMKLYHQTRPVSLKYFSRIEFYSDLHIVVSSIHRGSVKSFAYMRLKMLLVKFEMHEVFNCEREGFHQKVIPSRDFYNVVKVDNHVHLSACMTQKHLQKFIKKKMQGEPDTVVKIQHGTKITLKEVFDSIQVTERNLTTDVLNCMADKNTFNRVDRFNDKYNPFGQPVVREVFLKKEGLLRGRYFAEVVKEVLKHIQKEQYTRAEYSVSIFGKSKKELARLARWFSVYRLASPSVKWKLEIPRLYSVCRDKGKIRSFAELLNNIFYPLFEATLYPGKDAEVTEFLASVAALDFVHSEGDHAVSKHYPSPKLIDPEDWTTNDNPPFAYWAFYILANLYTLNLLRASRGLNTFAFRPHCGEAASEDNLAAAFLLAHSINHGIVLRNSPGLQYLYYLEQIGLSMSPLSNNKLFLKYVQNPFAKFLKRGLNVTLSTDEPLLIHMTRDPLLEEYSVAGQVLDLSQTDLCEIARNSVLQSGFSLQEKQEWLGESFLEGLPESNDMLRTNLSSIRYDYRYETFTEEHSYIRRISSNS